MANYVIEKNQKTYCICGPPKLKTKEVLILTLSILINAFPDELMMITLTLAHLRIGYLVGNPEVGNSEYVGHQDCPPQPLCFFAQFIRYMGPG